MIEMKVNKDSSEILPYHTTGVPIFIREGFLSSYPGYRALCHWHEDLEFICVLDGEMNFYIDGKTVLLKSGDSLMINSSQLHYGFSNKKRECYFYCIVLHPSLLTTNKFLYQKYIKPIIENTEIEYMLFQQDEQVSAILQKMYMLKTLPSTTYELDVISQFHTLWSIIFEIGTTKYQNSLEQENDELQIQRQMVSFIYQNYGSSITLQDIADTGKVCRSKCCKIFNKYMGQTPIDFLNAYRLETSLHLLETTDFSITEICTSCGFNHMSYFSKQFHQKYGCTPRNYRLSIEK